MHIVVNLLINGFAVFVTGYLLKGVHINFFFTAIIVSIVLGIVNALIKPILLIFTLPFNILTLGLFTFIINGFLIILVSKIVPGFYVDGFITAILFSMVLTVVNWFLNLLKN